jgi:hypothetical protein
VQDIRNIIERYRPNIFAEAILRYWESKLGTEWGNKPTYTESIRTKEVIRESKQSHQQYVVWIVIDRDEYHRHDHCPVIISPSTATMWQSSNNSECYSEHGYSATNDPNIHDLTCAISYRYCLYGLGEILGG